MQAIRHSWPAAELRSGARVAAGIALACLAIALLLARLPLPVAVTAALTLIGLAAAAAWPFAGLLLFVALVYVRPGDIFPELIGLRWVLLIGGGTFVVWVGAPVGSG